MKLHTLALSLLLAASGALAISAHADDAHHPDQKAGASAPAADQTIQKMQTNAKVMQMQLEKMAKSRDPKERMRLMQEHMKTMQENAGMAQGMMEMDCPMMGKGGMGQGMGMMGGQGGAGSDATMQRMQMMEKRMDMMQMMMEQMSKGQPAAK